MSRSHGVVYF